MPHDSFRCDLPEKDCVVMETSRGEQGNVTQATPARWVGRNGQLRFVFRQIELPDGASRKIEASLQGAQSAFETLADLMCSSRAFLTTPSTFILNDTVQGFFRAFGGPR
jgi:hypothetical protein